jgi:hypothetical protein
MPAVYHEVRGKNRLSVAGKLVVTSKKILFVGPKGGSEIQLSKVLEVTWGRAGIHLKLARQSASGDYDVQDAEVVALIIRAAVQIANRHLLPGAARDTRSIPQHVKAAVYQRDGGRCAQCGAQSYLEFDHVIPLSKGGATSVNNLQLLCRRCNAEKSDSI